MDHPPQPPAAASNKLFIRSEVLAVTEFLVTVENAPRQDKLKQIKRLQAIADQDTVQRVLIKELQRAAGYSRTVQVVTELLMEVGDIDVVKDPLWELIQYEQTPDEIKDAANLILRQLGDESDPNLYLDYLEDPAGLINRETERMLEVSARNPEALIDFLDFIYSLPVGEQGSLLESLTTDYPPEYLLNIFLPALLAIPPYETQLQLLQSLGQTRSPRAALFLHEMMDYYEEDTKLSRALKKSLSELRLAGVYRTDALDAMRRELPGPHPLVQESTLHACFATIPDGIGNQGLIIGRKRPNGDIVMMSVAINDLHGVMDCFGFYELSETDFHKITEKFHEECSKIRTSVDYCLTRLQAAEQLNREQHFRLPYEYSCWKVMLEDAAQEPINIPAQVLQWANEQWVPASANLYQHPDFHTWFLEEGDHPVVTDALSEVVRFCTNARNIGPEEFIAHMEGAAENLMRGLLATEWRNILAQRLADAAYLLDQQQTQTFCSLAATSSLMLSTYETTTPLVGFCRQYGRRCVEEALLRLPSGTLPEPLLQGVLNAWDV